MSKLTAFLLLFVSIFTYAQESNAPVEIPFNLTPNGHIPIEAKVNGKKAHLFLTQGQE